MEQLAAEYDFVLIDSTCNIEVWGWCACAVAQLILIPNGLNLRELREIGRSVGAVGLMLLLIYKLQKLRMKIVRHDTTRKAKYENADYQEVAARLFLETEIRESELLSKKRKQPLMLPVLSHPDSPLAEDYKRLADELMGEIY